jgi:hypothetical protein
MHLQIVSRSRFDKLFKEAFGGGISAIVPLYYLGPEVYALLKGFGIGFCGFISSSTLSSINGWTWRQ